MSPGADRFRGDRTARYVYRVTEVWPKRAWYRKRRRLVPMATRARVLAILNYQAELPQHERAEITIERIPLSDDWQKCNADFDIPPTGEL